MLQEIEAKLYEEDPALVREVSSTTIYSHALRNIRWAVLGFVGGGAATIVTLSTSYALAFVGFLVMWASALFAERNIRRMGRAGWQELTGTIKSNGVRSFVGSTGRKVRGRFRKD